MGNTNQPDGNSTVKKRKVENKCLPTQIKVHVATYIQSSDLIS